MKLKYYLRGIGIGVILTAIIMGFALGGRKAAMSDAQVIERAKQLGMTEGGVLSADGGEVEENGASYASSSAEALDEAGKEVSEEVDETVASASESVSELAEEEKKAENKETENAVSDDESDKASSEESSANTGVSTTDTAKQDSASSSSSALSDSSSEASVGNTSTETGTGTGTSTASSTGKTITIPGGTSSDTVAEILYREGLIDNAYSFNRYLIDQRLDRIIRSGTKFIPAGSTYADIAAIITK